jgi:hypothetical protein
MWYNNANESFKEMNFFKKILFNVRIILSIIIVALCFQMINYGNRLIPLAIFLLGIIIFFKGFENFKQNKTFSVISVLIGVFIIILSILSLFFIFGRFI